MHNLRGWISAIHHRVLLQLTGESPRTQQSLPATTAPVQWQAVDEYLQRPDLHAAMPWALTPAGCADFLRWCGRHAAHLPSPLAALHDLRRSGDKGVALTYRYRRDWQGLHPKALTADCHWRKFTAWLAVEYGMPGRWLADTTSPPDLPAAPELFLFAHWNYSSGLREVALAYKRAFESHGVALGTRNLAVPSQHHLDDTLRHDDLERAPISIVIAGAGNMLDDLWPKAGLQPARGVYRIAVVAWELDELPVGFAESSRLIDEFWPISEYVETSLRKVIHDKFIRPISPPVDATDPQAMNLQEFGLPPCRCTFLCVFDLSSTLIRKNPQGVIRAFLAAFPNGEDVSLALKVNHAETQPQVLLELCAAIRDPRIHLLTGTWERGRLQALMCVSDSIVSLHRSEGFGYTVAEGMLSGKPVIATDYGATTEFLTAEVGLPVRWSRKVIHESSGPYPAGATWAEPDIHHAAERMRWVYDHPVAASALGARAKEFARTRFSRDAFTERVMSRYREIAGGR